MVFTLPSVTAMAYEFGKVCGLFARLVLSLLSLLQNSVLKRGWSNLGTNYANAILGITFIIHSQLAEDLLTESINPWNLFYFTGNNINLSADVISSAVMGPRGYVTSFDSTHIYI